MSLYEVLLIGGASGAQRKTLSDAIRKAIEEFELKFGLDVEYEMRLTLR